MKRPAYAGQARTRKEETGLDRMEKQRPGQERKKGKVIDSTKQERP